MTANAIAKFLSFLILVLVTGGIGVLFFEVISPFLLPLFLAVVIVVMFWPLHRKYLSLCPGRGRLAAVLTTASVLLAVLLPSALVLMLAGNEAARLIRDWDQGEVNGKLQRLRVSVGLEYPVATELRFVERSLQRLRDDAREGAFAVGNRDALLRVRKEWQRLQEKMTTSGYPIAPSDAEPILAALDSAYAETPGTLAYQQAVEAAARRFRSFQIELLGGTWKALAKEAANPTSDEVGQWAERLFAVTPDWISSLGGRAGVVLGRSLFAGAILIVAMYFLFADGERIARKVMELSPLEDRYEEELLAEFTLIARAVVSGTVYAASAQSALAGLGFWLAGFHSVFLLMAITALTAIIPFVGAAFVWLPAGMWLIFVEGRPLAGALLMVYGFAVISTIDNIIRPLVLHGVSAMHPLAALIGVLGGIQTIGPLGVFIGPMAVALLQTLLSLLHRELSLLGESGSRRKRAEPPVRGSDAPPS